MSGVCHYCGGDVRQHRDSSCIDNKERQTTVKQTLPCGHEVVVPQVCWLCLAQSQPPSPQINGDASWVNWSNSIARCVRSIHDEKLKRAAEVIAAGRVVLTAGNGGSASLASHAAQAILKPDYRAGGGRPALCVNDMVPTHTAHANDGGWETAMLEVARPFLGPGAVVVLFSSSGKSPNVVALANEARDRQLEIVAFTGFRGEPLRSLSTVRVHVDSDDYEVVEPVHDALMHRVQYHLRNLNK